MEARLYAAVTQPRVLVGSVVGRGAHGATFESAQLTPSAMFEARPAA